MVCGVFECGGSRGKEVLGRVCSEVFIFFLLLSRPLSFLCCARSVVTKCKEASSASKKSGAKKKRVLSSPDAIRLGPFVFREEAVC